MDLSSTAEESTAASKTHGSSEDPGASPIGGGGKSSARKTAAPVVAAAATEMSRDVIRNTPPSKVGHSRQASKEMALRLGSKTTNELYIKDTPISLSKNQLGQLLPFIPMMLHWLRDQVDAHVHFLDECPRVQRDAALRRMLDVANYAGDISLAQWRELGEEHGPAAWASGVRKIVEDSEPKLIPVDVADALVGEWKETGVEDNFGPPLDRLTRTCYYALAELCASFRDTEDENIFDKLGPVLLSSKGTPEDDVICSRVLQAMVIKSELIFGRAACKKSAGLASLGARAPTNGAYRDSMAREMSVRSQSSNLGELRPVSAEGSAKSTPVALPRRTTRRMSTLPKTTEEEAILASRKQALKTFMHWQCDDDDMASRRTMMFIDDIFATHSFAHIAQAVQAKFGVLPPGWHVHLEDLPHIEWNSAEGVVRSLALAPATTDKRAKEIEAVHNVINEIIDSEVTYFESLAEVAGPFYNLLMNMATDPLRRETLGINEDDVDTLFGKRLERIVSTSNMLLSHLEVVSLVRQETKGPVSRAGIVAKAFLSIYVELRDTCAPFVSDHRTALHILQHAKRTNVRSTRLTITGLRRTMAGGKTSSDHFLKVWDDFASRSKRLKGQTVQSVLIMPIQRVPRYRLLLAELDKKLSNDDAAKEDLKTALSQVTTVCTQINQALKQHEKLESLVGYEDMPQIAGVRESSGRLHMSYKAKKAPA